MGRPDSEPRTGLPITRFFAATGTSSKFCSRLYYK